MKYGYPYPQQRAVRTEVCGTIKKYIDRPGMVEHICNPRPLGSRDL
jgi:hypothetical protein